MWLLDGGRWQSALFHAENGPNGSKYALVAEAISAASAAENAVAESIELAVEGVAGSAALATRE